MKAEISTTAPVDGPTEMSSSLAVSPHDGASTPIEPATANRPAPGEIPVSRYSPGLRLGEIPKGIGPTPNDVPGRRGALATDSIQEGEGQPLPERTEEGIQGAVVDRLSDTTGLPQEEVGKRLTQQPGDQDPTVGEKTNHEGYVRPEGDTIPTRRERDDRVRDALTELSQGGEGEVPDSPPVTEEPELIREQVVDESAVTRRRVVVSDDPDAGGEDTSQGEAGSGENGGDSEVPPTGGSGGNDSGGSDIPQEGGDDWKELEVGIKDLKSLGVENLSLEDRERLERALDEFETVAVQGKEDVLDTPLFTGDRELTHDQSTTETETDITPHIVVNEAPNTGGEDGEEPTPEDPDDRVLTELKDLFTAARDEEPSEEVIAALKEAIDTETDMTQVHPYPEGGDPIETGISDKDLTAKNIERVTEQSAEREAYIDERLRTYGITDRGEVGPEVIDALIEQYERSQTDQSAQSDSGVIETDPSGHESEDGLGSIEQYIEDKLRETEDVLGSRDSWEEGEEEQLAEEYRRQAMDRGITDQDTGRADVVVFPERMQEADVDSAPEGVEGDLVDLQERRREETLTGPERYYRLQEEHPGSTDRDVDSGDGDDLLGDPVERIEKGLEDSAARKGEPVVEIDRDEGLEAALAALGEELGGMTDADFAAEVQRQYDLQGDDDPQTDEPSGEEPPAEPPTDQAKDANEPEDGL